MEIQISLTEKELNDLEKSLDHIILTFYSVDYFKDTLDLLKKIDLQIKNRRSLIEKHGEAKALWNSSTKCSTESCGHSDSVHSGRGNGVCSQEGCPCLRFT